MFDAYGRKIDYLRISVTDKCNLRCTYCMPAHGVPLRTHNEVLRVEQYVQLVRAAAMLGITKVRITGGEPLVRRGILELIRGIAGVPGISQIGVTTNGLLLSRMAVELKQAGVTHLNVSLDTLDPEDYRRITRGGDVNRVLDGIAAAKAAGFTGIKINTVVQAQGSAPHIDDLETFCRDNGCRLQRIAEYSLLEDKHDGHGLERPLPCTECNRIRLLSNGVLKPCLHSDIEVPVDWDDPAASILQTVARKPEHGTVCTNRQMVEIGG